MGTAYNFKVVARNAFGFSADSNIVNILQAEYPHVPVAPTTIVVSDTSVIIDWEAPSAQGSPITAYTISIRQSDGLTYDTELTSCDGTDPVIVSGTTCSVPIPALQAAPFSLPWGSSIYAKIIATNIYGSSANSDEGNGAIILTIPDTPINFANNAVLTSASQISLTWEDGPSDGGTSIISYRISFD